MGGLAGRGCRDRGGGGGAGVLGKEGGVDVDAAVTGGVEETRGDEKAKGNSDDEVDGTVGGLARVRKS